MGPHIAPNIAMTDKPSENLFDLLEKTARLCPDRHALSCCGRSFTYGQFAGRAARLADLFSQSPGPEPVVAMLHRNCHLVLEAYFAAASLGTLFVPVNTRLSDREVASILKDSGADLLVTEPSFEPLAHAALDRIPESRPRLVVCRDGEWAPEGTEAQRPEERSSGGDDPAQLYYTSGTTGAPKGVILTHKNVSSHADAAIAELGLSKNDVWLHAAPLFHLADAWATWAVTKVGGRHVLLTDFEPDAVFDIIESEGVTITNLIPAMLVRLVHHPAADKSRLKSMRLIMSGGAPMAPELLKKVEDLFPCEYIQTYGLTETSPFLTMSLLDEKIRSFPPEEQRRYRAMTGRPIRGVDVRVKDEKGRDVPRDGRTVGEIVARGPTVTPGYFKQPEETRRAFRGGWFHTGDLAHVEAEGFLTIVDRIKDVINTGGELVYSTEVENILFAHPAVREAAVFAVPDETWGESVRAAVAFQKGTTVDIGDLIAFCRGRLAPFKIPRSIDIVESLPRTGSGKIDKKSLREPFWRGKEKEVQ